MYCMGLTWYIQAYCAEKLFRTWACSGAACMCVSAASVWNVGHSEKSVWTASELSWDLARNLITGSDTSTD